MITWIIIAVTCLVSYLAFTNPRLMDKFQFNAARVIHQNQYYRLLSHALVHANWTHLFVNMLVLYFFGSSVEAYLGFYFGKEAILFFIILYTGGALCSNLIALVKNRDNYYYNAIGASGAVSAVLFTFIFFNPWEKLYFFGLIPIPGIVFAAGYLLYSWIMSRKETGNIAHDAHFLGALFGFLLPVVLKPNLLERFIDQLFRLI